MCVCVWLWGCVDEALTQYPSHVSSLPALPPTHSGTLFHLRQCSVSWILQPLPSDAANTFALHSTGHSLLKRWGGPLISMPLLSSSSSYPTFWECEHPSSWARKVWCSARAMDEAAHGCCLGLTPFPVCPQACWLASLNFCFPVFERKIMAPIPLLAGRSNWDDVNKHQ